MARISPHQHSHSENKTELYEGIRDRNCSKMLNTGENLAVVSPLQVAGRQLDNRWTTAGQPLDNLNGRAREILNGRTRETLNGRKRPAVEGLSRPAVVIYTGRSFNTRKSLQLLNIPLN
ncbi:Hypothetical predicted protein [Xyrichtys novacula]|uniref:Uncharacterized protein n=1 Tax=Xyrichtys novacula TaxID=13765 RepID=A0AAV1EI82_XYRNO|nr:Hypothetical predicted protein [Xyrichtys novacula]